MPTTAGRAVIFCAVLFAGIANTAWAQSSTTCPSILNHRFKRLQDEAPQDLCQYAGKVVLVVNTASYCGFTHQYKGLEALQAKYQPKGLVVLGFPSNDFGKQEPGSNKEVADFCLNTDGVAPLDRTLSPEQSEEQSFAAADLDILSGAPNGVPVSSRHDRGASGRRPRAIPDGDNNAHAVHAPSARASIHACAHSISSIRWPIRNRDAPQVHAHTVPVAGRL